MSVAQFENLLGEWSGAKQVFLEEEVFDSRSTASVKHNIKEQFILISYKWEFDGSPQEGLILFNSQLDERPSRSIWLDSWHMRSEIMYCVGSMGENGVVSFTGSYTVQNSPDWGWRIEIKLSDVDSLEMRMINISPQGEEALGVLAQYSRTHPSG